jgi:hypothetical protein
MKRIIIAIHKQIIHKIYLKSHISIYISFMKPITIAIHEQIIHRESKEKKRRGGATMNESISNDFVFSRLIGAATAPGLARRGLARAEARPERHATAPGQPGPRPPPR